MGGAKKSGSGVVRKKGKRKKFTGRNDGPARKRYRAENRLMHHKIRNLMHYNRLSEAEAMVLWLDSRTRSR